MFPHASLARFSRLARGPLCAAASPLRFLQGSVGQHNLHSFAMERAQGALNNTAKHRKTNSPVQRWRPVSTEASPLKGATKVVIEDTMEITGEKYSSSVEVDVPLMRFVKGKGGSMQKQIEKETGVKIIFPSLKEETLVVLEGKSAESITKASERIAKVLEEAVQSPMLLSFHITSVGNPPGSCREAEQLPELNTRGFCIYCRYDKDESLSEGSVDESDQVENPSASINLRVQEEKSVSENG